MHGSRAGRSHLGPTCATSCGAQGHCAQLGTRLQRASELSKVPPTVELEEARSGAAGRQALWHAVRLTWHGQKWAGSGSRMQRGSTVGLPGVAGRSWPCPPLDLLRSPAERLESTRSAMCVFPLSLPFFSALRDRHRTWMGTWRRSVSMCPCRCGSERARHGRMAGTRAKTRDGRRRGRRKFPVRPVNIKGGKWYSCPLRTMRCPWLS